MTDVRPAAVAGTWYAASADRLGRDVDGYIAAAELDPIPAPVAIIAPHAGLKYSGPVAAFAYKSVSRAQYRAAVLVGPSHFVGFSGVSIWPRGAWQTPFGPVRVDEELAERIASASPDVIEHRPAHEREHSLEMQLPFVAHLLPGVPIAYSSITPGPGGGPSWRARWPPWSSRSPSGRGPSGPRPGTGSTTRGCGRG